jgi:hypothetical protein
LVERCFIYRINGDGSRQRACNNEGAHGGRAVWRRGGIDNMIGKVNTLILLEDGGGDLSNVPISVRSRFAGPVCVPNSL